MSKYRADSVGIEDIWNTETTDTADNDLVILRLIYKRMTFPAGDFKWFRTGGLLKKKGYATVVAYPWNIEISPKRMLLNHQAFINSCCFGLSGEVITFLSGTNDQEHNDTSLNLVVPIWEPQYTGFTISDTDTWFRPIEINIDAAYPSDLVNKIALNPYGVVEFTYRDNIYKGYILKMETKLSGKGSVKYSLLSVDDNDLTKLIR
jgi:hypothetical protein